MEIFKAEQYIGTYTDISLSRRYVTETFPLHWHDFFEIEIILGGKGEHKLNGNTYSLEKGDMYLLTPTDYHEVIPHDGVEIFNIMFHENLLSEDFLDIVSGYNGDIMLKLGEGDFEAVVMLCSLLNKEYSEESPYREVFIKNLMQCLIIQILRKTDIGSKGTKKESGHLQKAIQYIHLHFKDNPSLKDVAKIAGTNPNYFSTRFKEETGVGYSEYLNKRKLKYAKQLLKTSSLSVTEICYASGFASLSNFMRVFKEKTGQSPSQYIKKDL